MKHAAIFSIAAAGLFLISIPAAIALPTTTFSRSIAEATESSIIEVKSGSQGFNTKRWKGNNGRHLGWSKGRGNPHRSSYTTRRSNGRSVYSR